MEREILFRGKRIDNGEWVYGNYVSIRGIADGKEFEEHHITSFAAWEDNYKVDGKTVGQFIGLTDKDGKKIFEGDILGIDSAYAKHYGYPVVKIGNWEDSEYSYNEGYGDYDDGNNPSGYGVIIKGKTFDASISQSQAWNFHIIGNIYDNPNLINI